MLCSHLGAKCVCCESNRNRSTTQETDNQGTGKARSGWTQNLLRLLLHVGGSAYLALPHRGKLCTHRATRFNTKTQSRAQNGLETTARAQAIMWFVCRGDSQKTNSVLRAYAILQAGQPGQVGEVEAFITSLCLTTNVMEDKPVIRSARRQNQQFHTHSKPRMV